MSGDAWAYMALIALTVAAGIVMYGLGFLHVRDAERGRWSAQREANRELRVIRGSGPRSLP